MNNPFSPRRQTKRLNRHAQARKKLHFESLEDRRVLSAIPILNSLPGATASLYLDFDGHSEASWGEYSNVNGPAFDIDGNPSDLNAEELTFVQELWQIVAENYAPFNINVTTVEPPVLAVGVPSDQANGEALRVAIGGSGVNVLGTGYAGYAYINSFTDSIANVAYVFPISSSGSLMSSLSGGIIASHEAGHAFGLQHFASAVDLDAGYQSLMNTSSYGLEDATWSSGINYLGNSQDDLAVIARSTNGFGYRADDHADTITGSTPLALAGSTWTATGVITTTGDVDVFSITTPQTKSLRIAVEGDPLAQNLDVAIDLLDASGNLLATASPTDSKDAILFGEVTGTQYIAVRSNGEYGRVGQYSLSVTESSPGITVDGASILPTTDELGRSESVTISLSSKPTSDVAFYVASSDTTEGTVSTSQMVFTTSNWYVPQTFVITGVADAVADSDQGYVVTVSPAVSADSNYHGIFDPPDLQVVNLDNHAGKLFWVRSDDLPSYNGYVEGFAGWTQQRETLVDLEAAFGTSATNQTPSDIAVDADGGKIYWTDTGVDEIRRANLDGSSPETILSGIPNLTGIAVDSTAGKLYWVDSSIDKIQRSNLDGSNVEDILTTGLISPGSLKLDAANGKMYWRDSSTFTVNRANVDGSQVEIVLPSDGQNRPYSLEVDDTAGKIYIGMKDLDNVSRIYRADIDGANLELLVDLSALTAPIYFGIAPPIQGMAIDHDADRLYWSFQERVFSASLDGTEIALIAEDIERLRGIDFVEQAPLPPEITLIFADSFEVGEWNGLWVEDSQNDWFRSTQRATDGVRSAEVDGSANNATLTLATPLNLSGYTSAELSFDWLIESGFDGGEYLTLDVFNGTTWVNDVRRLNGNVDPENVWHSETVDITPFASASTLIRFRSKVSSSTEDANLDNVSITGVVANLGPNEDPTADLGGLYAIDEGSSVTVDASASTDSDGTIVDYAWDLDGDGQYDDASGPTANFTTTASGSYIVGLQVTDNRGGIDTGTTSVVVNNVAPTADAGRRPNCVCRLERCSLRRRVERSRQRHRRLCLGSRRRRTI